MIFNGYTIYLSDFRTLILTSDKYNLDPTFNGSLSPRIDTRDPSPVATWMNLSELSERIVDYYIEEDHLLIETRDSYYELTGTHPDNFKLVLSQIKETATR